MIQIARDAPGSIACGRSGLPILAICPSGHRHTVPFRLLKTSEDDRTPLYGRPFKCRECGSREVAALYAIETQAELDDLRQEPLLPRPTLPHSTHTPRNPDADLLSPLDDVVRVDPFNGVPYSFGALRKTFGRLYVRCDVCRRFA